MAPKRKNNGTTPSIIDAFNAVKKQPKLHFGNVFKPNEIIDISESQQDQPGPSMPTSNASFHMNEDVENARRWNPAEKKPVERIKSISRRSIVQPVSETSLRELGCEVDELKVIEVDANLECIQEDVQVVRQLIASNCALILPKRTIFVLSMFMRNWLRIFPIGRICICTLDKDGEWINAVQEECSLMGIDRASFSLPSIEIPTSARLMLASSKTLEKLISKDPLASEIRCVIFHLTGLTTPNAMKTIVNCMLIKKIHCRFILIGGGGSIGGKGTAVQRRQSIITNFHVSEWVEPREDLFDVVIKPRIIDPVKIWTWNETDNPFLIMVMDQLEEAINDLTDGRRGFGKGMEKMNVRDVIFAPLHLLSNNNSGKDEHKRLLTLVSLFYHLFSFGKEAFKKRLKVVASESEELEMQLLSSVPFTQTLIAVDELEGGKHKKMKQIKEIIHKAVARRRGERVRGVLLVESPSLVDSMAESLSMMCGVLGVD
ncbi:hypothetical protein PMAYCL1PPCAC_23710, partial [Pristionchus mayeri]